MLSMKPIVACLLTLYVADCAPTLKEEDSPLSFNDASIAKQGVVGVTRTKNVTSYDFSHMQLPVPKDYDSWDDASFLAPDDTLILIESGNSTVDQLLYASQVAGTPSWVFKAAVESAKRGQTLEELAALIEQALSETGDYELLETVISKRSIHSWLGHAWTRSNRHKTRGPAVGALATFIGSLSGETFDYGRRSVCVDTEQGKACLLWSGVSNAFKISLAKQILEDARGVIGNSAMSLEAYSGAYGCKREVQLSKRCGRVSICVSNRPKGCK